MMKKFKNFKKDTDGNVGMMFAGGALMLLISIGAAVDYSNISRQQSALQAQVDAAVLAAATVQVDLKTNGNGNANGRSKKEFETREDAARKVIAANGFDLNTIDPVVTLNEHSVEVRAELSYKPFFGGLLGVNNVRVVAESESGLPGAATIDLVLVLDSTDSMRVNGKMDALKEGAANLVDAIEESGSESKIGLVPFSRYVRINPSLRTANWFQMPTEFDTDVTWQQPIRTGGTCNQETRTRTIDGVEEQYQRNVCTGQTTTYEQRSATVESRWNGCVGTRATPLSEMDDLYYNRIPGLLNNVPPEHSGASNNAYSDCPGEIMPLTVDYGDLKSGINAMSTIDNTYLPSGLIWGQRVLSPGEPFDNAPVPGETENQKVMILMTDGINTTEIREDPTSQTQWEAPPYIARVDSDEVADEANAATARLCQSVKDDDIDIYTIAFQVTDAATRTLLRNCASNPDQALTADSNNDLIAEFNNIANRLEAEIRLMR